METRKVSIIIPVKPGGAVRALDSLQQLDYPAADVEIIVAEGKCPSRQRNRAAGAARGEILYFLDDDSLVSPLLLRRAVGHYADPSVAVAGGPSITPESDTPLQQSFALALASRFGSGGVRNRYRRSGGVRLTGDNELILCNLSMRREVFASFGGFDERLYPNEENELMVRIGKAGWGLVHDPDLVVYRSQRKTCKAFVRQLFGYGRGRAQQTLIGGISSVASFIPAFFLLYLLALPLLGKPVYYLPLLCYLVTGLCFACGEAIAAAKPRLALPLCCLYPVLHLSYGAGIIWGFLSAPFNKARKQDGEVVLRRVREFDSRTETVSATETQRLRV